MKLDAAAENLQSQRADQSLQLVYTQINDHIQLETLHTHNFL